MDKLKQSLIDALEEGQLKLGYRREAVRLYYPLASLCALLDLQADRAGMHAALLAFAQAQRGFFGEIAISHRGDRFCLTVPPEGVERVHSQVDEHGFLAQFLRVVSRHGATLYDVLAVFRRHSDRVTVRELHGCEFNYLVYFEDGLPNAYYYCIAEEPCHLTYHRFTREDYDAFRFEEA